MQLDDRLHVSVVQYGIKKKVPIEPSQDPALEGRLGRKKKTPEELAAEAQLAEQEAARSSTYHSVVMETFYFISSLKCRRKTSRTDDVCSMHLHSVKTVKEAVDRWTRMLYVLLHKIHRIYIHVHCVGKKRQNVLAIFSTKLVRF